MFPHTRPKEGDHHMSDSRYFALKGEHGVDHADNLEPLQEIGISVSVPTMVPGASNTDIVEVPHIIKVESANGLGDRRARIIPGTRFVETNDPLVASALLECGQYTEVDEPGKGAIDKARKQTAAHQDAMKQRDQAVTAGDIPAPDADDTTPTIDNPAAAAAEEA